MIRKASINTHFPGTTLFRDVNSGATSLPADDTVCDMYDVAVARLASAGLHRYEVSNFASSFETESAHNKWYWSGGEYVGVGPGAHSRSEPGCREVA